MLRQLSSFILHPSSFRLIAVTALVLSAVSTAHAQIRLKNICRLKGQEENTLHGLGLVVGLKGTGDGGNYLPTIRSLAMAMELMGNQIGKGGAGELKDTRNVALVTVTAKVPSFGARQGDKIDCTVSSIGAAKSLEGGRLFLTPLLGPQAEGMRVYALADGAVHIDDPKLPTSGSVHHGCQLEEDLLNAFVKNNKITLVLDEHHADFEVSQEIAELINSNWYDTSASELSRRPTAPGRLMSFNSESGYLAKAINPLFVEVTIPPQYRENAVDFVAQVLALSIGEPQTAARVVINEKTGIVVIGADVEIGSVVVHHKNITVETGADLPAERFVGVDPSELQTAKLKALVAALNAVKAPPADIIEIIKGLERDGKLHAQVIVQ
jgi:flagellar P-ring protein FlgI